MRGEVDAEYEERLKTARARARKVEKAASLYKSTLKRLHEVEEELEEAQQELDDEFGEAAEEDAEAERQAAINALARIRAMPTWQPQRVSGRGGGRQFDLVYRRAIYAQYENNTPKSAIGANIVSVVKATAPWLEPVPPSTATLSNTRFELRAVVECSHHTEHEFSEHWQGVHNVRFLEKLKGGRVVDWVVVWAAGGVASQSSIGTRQRGSIRAWARRNATKLQ